MQPDNNAYTGDSGIGEVPDNEEGGGQSLGNSDSVGRQALHNHADSPPHGGASHPCLELVSTRSKQSYRRLEEGLEDVVVEEAG